jgi:hypothetical protein
MTTTTFQLELPGANPFSLSGPAVSGSGKPFPEFKYGTTVALGDAGAEFISASLTLGSTTSLTDGQVYVLDKDFAATLLSTANSPRGCEVGVGRVAQANVPAATYGIWLQRAGHVAVQANASAPGNQLCETTATAGQINAAASPTGGSKLIVGLYLHATNGGSPGTCAANVMWPYVDKTN